jgi:acyl-CoA thioesterase FadM
MSEFLETLARVRYKDTDQMGMVYYGNYFTFFEIGRNRGWGQARLRKRNEPIRSAAA